MARAPIRSTLAVLTAVALLPVLVAPAAALCTPPPAPSDALARAPVAFVGTVTSVADGGYTATFHVQEIWKGTNLSDPITVYGGSSLAEDSRLWQVGTDYLVFPTVDANGNLIDTGCSPTVHYTATLASLRPASAHAPQGPPTSGIPGDPPIAAVFLVIVVLGTLGAVALWRLGPRQVPPSA